MPKLLRIAYLWFAVSPVATPVPTLVAQQRPTPVTVRGLAFDALQNRPLSDALVTLVGGGRNTVTDSRGRFHFDSVLPGPHIFAMHHSALDSLGFSGLTTRATITNGHAEVRITVPTFDALWKVACGGRPPADSGFVYGTVRDATTQRVVTGATIELVWVDLFLDRRRHLTQRRWRAEARSDSTGSYSICGVAPEQWLEVKARTDSSVSGVIELAPSQQRVHRLDLRIGRPPRDSSRRPSLAGIVTDPAGAPLSDARIMTDGAPETRSDAQGRFEIAHLSPGTHQVEAFAVGHLPTTTIVDLRDGDTTRIALRIASAVILDAVSVKAERASRSLAGAFTARRKSGVGYSMDSTDIVRFPALSNALETTFPSLRVFRGGGSLTLTMPRSRGGECAPEVRIDGLEAAFNHLIDLQPREVAGIEVFQRATMAPPQFMHPKGAGECGLILVWTKYGFRNR